MRKAVAAFLLALEANGRAERTIFTYKERLGYLVEFLEGLGVYEVEAVGAGDLDAYVVSQYRRSLSPYTIGGRIMVAKAFFAWCVRRHYLSESPAVHLRKPKAERSRSKAMALDDLRKLIEVAEERGNLRDLGVLLLLGDSGCRSGELVSLRVADLDLARCEARVRGKSGARVIYFTEQTARAIREWLAVRDVEDGTLFGMSYHAVYKMMQRLARRAGIEGCCNPHSIRHAVGQSWADQSVNPALIQAKLGHKSVEVTLMFYSHQDGKRVKAATERYSLVGHEEKG